VAIALALLACDAGNLVAMVNPPTETPTRTLRPTFTPRPAVTPTSEDTPTPQATDTPSASPTATKRAVATTRPATPKPAATAPPPPPQFAWKVIASDGSHGKCTTGVPVFEIEGRIWSGTYIGGIHVVALDKDGKIVAQMDSLYPDQQNLEHNVSCFGDTLPSYKLDVTAGRFNGPLILRLTKSAIDLTPISPDAQITFDASGGRYYIDFIQ